MGNPVPEYPSPLAAVVPESHTVVANRVGLAAIVALRQPHPASHQHEHDQGDD
jgi:hypothetical protein